MPTLPLVRGGVAQVLYPFTRRVKFSTMIHVAADGKEQRAAGRGVPLFEGTLTYNELNAADFALINNFFAARSGQFQTWDMTIGGKTYSNLKFTQDVIEWDESSPKLYSTKLGWRQLNNAGYTIPIPGASFPNLSVGVITQYPYRPGYRQLTTVNDQASGWAYPYRWYGAGLTGFSTAAVRRWTLSNPVLPDADVVTIENDFVGRLGMWGAMSLQDPEDGLAPHANCRYGSDVLQIEYLGPNQTAINFVIEETNG